MVQKGDRTKREILQAAQELFCQHGYAAVTMSDLCAATGLSRGGLYRHYSSTEEVFAALLNLDKDDWQAEMERAMSAGISAANMLTYFFEQAQTSIHSDGGRLSLAIYEFERAAQGRREFLAERYAQAVGMMERILKYGQSRGEFHTVDARTEAEQILILIEGLKMAGAVIPAVRESDSRHLDAIMKRLTVEESRE